METLPTEIRKIIVSFLDDRSRRIMRLANTDWFNKIQYSDFIFNFTTEERIPQLVQRLAKYNHPLSVVFEKSKCTLSAKDYEDIGKLTQLTKIIFNTIRNYNQDPDSVLDPLTNLTNLQEMDVSITRNNRIRRHLTNLRDLFLESIGDAQELDLARFSKLESVTWSVPEDENEGSTQNMSLILPHTKHIRSMAIGISERPAFNEADLTHFPNLADLILQSARSFNIPYLPNLETMFFDVAEIRGLSNLPKLRSLEGYSKTIDFSEFSALTNLRRLLVEWPICKATDFQFLTALTNLESLNLNIPYDRDYSACLAYISSTKLTTLEYKAQYAFVYITKFVNLQSLVLNVSQYACEMLPDLGLLSNLTHLRMLGVDEDMFKAIERLTTLRTLDLVLHWRANSSRMFQLGKFSALEQFTLNGTATKFVDFSGIQHLPLKNLELGHIDNEFIKRISTITTLERLSVFNSTLHNESIIGRLSNLNHLTQLSVFDSSMTDVNMNLTLLTSLQVLILRGINSDLDAKELKKKMPRLFELILLGK